MQGLSWSTHFSVFQLCLALRVSWSYNHGNVSSSSGVLRSSDTSGSISRYVGLIQPPILASIAYLDMNANIQKLGAWRIHIIRCTWRFLNHNTELASKIYIWTAETVFRMLSRHASNCILLSQASLYSGTPRIASSSTACYFVALFSHYSITLPTVFTILCFCLHSGTSLHQHGTYCQPGEQSRFTEESRSPPWASTCTCIQEDSQFSFLIKCLNFDIHV